MNAPSHARGDVEGSTESQPTRRVALFPHTQVVIPQGPCNPNDAVRNKAERLPRLDATPKTQRTLPHSPKSAALTPGTSKKRIGSILGEFRVDGRGTALVDESKHGTTPLPETKSGSRNRLAKAQREPLERAGATPPSELVAKPKTKSRKSALKDDGPPVGWKRRQGKPKEGVSDPSPKTLKGETRRKRECENVMNLLELRGPPPKNPQGESALKKQDEPAADTQKLQQEAVTEPTQRPFRNPFPAEVIAVESYF